MSDAKDVTKLVKTAVRIMITRLKAQRALVIVDEKNRERPEPLAAYGLDPKETWDDTSVSKDVLLHALDKARPVYVVDARKKDNIKSKECHRCIVCVPLGKHSDDFTGVLYCDHEEPGALELSVKSALEEMAREFNRVYEELQKSGGTTKKEARSRSGEETNYESDAEDLKLKVKAALLVLVVMVILICYYLQLE